MEEKILPQNQAISITVLNDLYGGHVQDTRYRSKLKAKILSKFPNQLLFVTIDGKHQVGISSYGIKSNTLLKNRERNLNQAADFLGEDVQK